jgi:hypothetical protein
MCGRSYDKRAKESAKKFVDSQQTTQIPGRYKSKDMLPYLGWELLGSICRGL